MNAKQRRLERRKGNCGGILRNSVGLFITGYGMKSFARCPECNAEIREKAIVHGQHSFVCLAGHFGPWKPEYFRAG